MKKLTALLALTFAVTVSLSALAAQDDEKDFTPLFNGQNLTGWRVRNIKKPSWSVQPGGILKNTATQMEHNGSDLETTKKYWNFTIRYEYVVPQGARSGVFLRGRHAITIFGDYGNKAPLNQTCNGSIYGIKAPDKFVSKPPTEWQTVEATMIGDRITVTLNGVLVHDNVQCSKATGDEIDRKVLDPGAIMLQGIHGPVSFRNIRIKELPKDAAAKP